MRELLRIRSFRLLFAAQTLSMFGDWTLLLVFGIWAKTLTGSNAAAGMMIFAMAAPGLLAPLGGLLVDRVRRRPLMIALDLLSAGVVMLLWLVHDRGELWLLVVVACWSGLVSVVFSAAVSGLVQSMLEPELLGPANGALATVRQALRLVGPLLGAGLFSAFGGRWVATLDAATFVASAVALLAVRHHEARPVREAVTFLTEAGAGLRHLIGQPVLKRLLAASVLCVCGFGLTESAVFALVSDGLHRPVTFIGVLVSVQGIGAIAGGVAVTRAIRRVRELELALVGFVLCAAGSVLVMLPGLVPVMTGVVLFGVALPVVQVASITLLQRATPNALMGRVSAAFDVSATLPYTLFIGLGAALVGLVAYQWIFAVVALTCLLAGAYTATGLRLQDPVADADVIRTGPWGAPSV